MLIEFDSVFKGSGPDNAKPVHALPVGCKQKQRHSHRLDKV